MPRPMCRRMIQGAPDFTLFKPAGIPAKQLELLVLTLDEVEAIRLTGLDGLYQEAAAERMGVSRRTFGRILESANRKVAAALVQGKALKIEGGAVEISSARAGGCGLHRHGHGRGGGCGRR